MICFIYSFHFSLMCSVNCCCPLSCTDVWELSWCHSNTNRIVRLTVPLEVPDYWTKGDIGDGINIQCVKPAVLVILLSRNPMQERKKALLNRKYQKEYWLSEFSQRSLSYSSIIKLGKDKFIFRLMFRKTQNCHPLFCSLCKRFNEFDPFLGFQVKGFSSILSSCLDFFG